jgi:TolB-like protein
MKRSHPNCLVCKSNIRRGIGALFIAMALNLTADYARAATIDNAAPAFRHFAQQLLAGIGSASVEDIPALGGYGKPRIAVAPFRNDGKPVTHALASEFNSRLLAELTRQGSRAYRFVARETLKEIIRDIDAIGELDGPKNTHVSDLLRNAKVDILIVGKLRKSNESVVVSYKALSVENGIVFAATRPHSIDLTGPRPIRVRTLRPVPEGGLGRGGRRPVLHAQRLLFVLGYDPGPADGRMRPHLRRAIRAYERDFGRTVTGRMTRRLIRDLRLSVRAEDKTVLAVP